MNNYGIRDGYTARETPAYFVDNQPDHKVWQPEVLGISAHIARKLGAKTLLDIGCGQGAKLEPYAAEFNIIGVDYGENIGIARKHSFGDWLEVDLEQGLPPFDVSVLQNSVLICSDVVEHLVNPGTLIMGLVSWAKLYAKALILTTPDRYRTYGFDQSGPPGNPHHIREWSFWEMVQYTQKHGGKPTWAGWTLSNNVDRQRNTMLLIFQNSPAAYDTSEIEQLFDVERSE